MLSQMVGQDKFKEREFRKINDFSISIGTFCHQLLSNASRWKEGTTLVDVVTVVVKHLDEPDLLYPANSGKDFLISISFITFSLLQKY